MSSRLPRTQGACWPLRSGQSGLHPITCGAVEESITFTPLTFWRTPCVPVTPPFNRFNHSVLLALSYCAGHHRRCSRHGKRPGRRGGERRDGDRHQHRQERRHPHCSRTTAEHTSPLICPSANTRSRVDSPGFQKLTKEPITVNVNDKLTYDFTLTPGTAQQVVNVSGDQQQVQLEDATAQGLISGTQIRELSINNRNYEQLIALTPGVTSGVADQIFVGVSNPAGTSNQINFSINGGRPTQNNFTVDGADNVDRGANLTLLTYPSVDAISEFKVLRGQYNAEYGRSSSGQINVITRSGESRFHGSLYEFFRNDVLNANSYFDKHFASPADIRSPRKAALQRLRRHLWRPRLHP